MRLACRAFRDVKPFRFVLHPRIHIKPPSSQQYTRDLHFRALQPRKANRHFSSTSLADPEDVAAVLSSKPTDTLQVSRETPTRHEPDASLIQSTQLFGRWRALLNDPSRLAVESDFARTGPAKGWKGRLLVDKIVNRGNFALWTCLLDYQARINGNAGVHTVWKGLWGRKCLYDVESPLAPMFWRVMLEAALKSDDDKFLESVWIYSEWMLNVHGVKWPHIYSTITTHFLRTHQHQQALMWQLRLTPNFYPGPDEFAKMVKEFATDQELYQTLWSIYVANPDKRLYDTLIPYLYGRGESQLALRWRRTMVRHDDLPLAPVPIRPFLRYLQGYFPNETLHPAELAAAGDLRSESSADTQQPGISREFVNRVHGGTFGISVKNYNDRLGAKWFASSWVSLDTAISGMSALGVEKIGPLSLQSIALREGTPEGVFSRMAHLQEYGISIVESNYVKVIRYLAKLKDNELLLDLLQSDLHPDVFDDLELQARLLDSTAESSDWRTHRLLKATKIVAMEETARESANALVRTHFLSRNQQGLLGVLADMKSTKLGLDHQQTDLIFVSLVKEFKSTVFPREPLDFYLSVCRQLTSMEVPVPVRCWRKILFSLIRQGRQDDIETLCLELVRLFTSFQSSRPGFVAVHLEDVPEDLKKPLSGVENLLGLYIPLDLPRQVPLHPLRQIFDPKMIRTMVRLSFFTPLDRSMKNVPTLRSRRHRPQDFHCGFAVRLLRILRDRGLYVHSQVLTRYVKINLVRLYGPGIPAKRRTQLVKASNPLSLKEMKALLDEAWGEELLPPLEELKAAIEKDGRAILLKEAVFLQSKGRMRPHLGVVL